MDGNKRLGWLATAVFCELDGVEMTTIANDDVVDVVMGVAAGQPALDEIAARLRSLAGA